MKKRMLADVLWTAANECLLIERYSCHAVAMAQFGVKWRARNWSNATTTRFMRELGCPVGSGVNQSAWNWLIRESDEDQTGVRYMWLLLAMHVAEDEGIEV